MRWLLSCGFLAGVLGGSIPGADGPPLVIYGAMRRWSPPALPAQPCGDNFLHRKHCRHARILVRRIMDTPRSAPGITCSLYPPQFQPSFSAEPSKSPPARRSLPQSRPLTGLVCHRHSSADPGNPPHVKAAKTTGAVTPFHSTSLKEQLVGLLVVSGSLAGCRVSPPWFLQSSAAPDVFSWSRCLRVVQSKQEHRRASCDPHAKENPYN